MNYTSTFFKNIFDNDASNSFTFSTWDKFETFLFDLSEKPAFKPKRGEAIPKGKTSALLISPATYIENSTRANKNVVEWTWCGVDVDQHDFDPNEDLQKQLVDRIGDYYFIASSTSSSRVDHPKFRLIFPLKTAVPASKIKDFWYAINKVIGFVGDAQTKDLSRMFYVPGRYNDAHHFFIINKGQFIDPFALISNNPNKEKKPDNFFDRLPKEAQLLMIDYRKKQSGAMLEYAWNSYRDCPFVNKKVLNNFTNVASIDNSGRYFNLYKIMVSIAGSAIDKKYPITPLQIVDIVNQIDLEHGARYQGWRDMQKEAEHAIEYAYTKS